MSQKLRDIRGQAFGSGEIDHTGDAMAAEAKEVLKPTASISGLGLKAWV